MDNARELRIFISNIVRDDRLKPIHLSVSLALCHIWITNGLDRSYHISRNVVMKAARIRSKATYHKVIRELRSLGYIEYRPSYHPKKGSRISMVTDG